MSGLEFCPRCRSPLASEIVVDERDYTPEALPTAYAETGFLVCTQCRSVWDPTKHRA